jgi:predicted lipoprotein with Yx(FWY)xxD motif
MERDYFCEDEICCANNDPNMPKRNSKINARSCIGIIAKKQGFKTIRKEGKPLLQQKKEPPRCKCITQVAAEENLALIAQ